MDGVEQRLCNWLINNTCGKPTFLIPGNHDLHGLTRKSAFAALCQAYSGSPVRVLMDSYAEITPGLAVYGSDYWTDLELTRNRLQVSQVLENSWDDFKNIKTETDQGKRTITAKDTINWHQKAKDKLAAFASQYQGRYILMTHHGAFKEVLPVNKNNQHSLGELDAAYTSDGSAFINSLNNKPLLCVNGHLHIHHQSVVNGIRLYANPRGNDGQLSEETLSFD